MDPNPNPPESTVPPPPPPTPEMAPPPPPYQPVATTPPPPGASMPSSGVMANTGPRNPIISLVVSAVVPGLGQILFTEERGKGIGMLIGYVVCFVLFFLIITLVVALGIWIWAMYDAYNGTKKWNVAHGYPAG